MNVRNIMADIIGLSFRKKLPRKNPKRMFKIMTLIFCFLPFEKIMKTTADIQKNARTIAMISCL